MFNRDISPLLLKAAKKMPVIGVLGPRQSGKTTMVKAVFNKYDYVSLENFQERELADSDPKRFLQNYENEHGIILDEIQHVPKLLSYIQTYVDENPRAGYIVITGSQNILLNQGISQTLAGRISLFTLLPLSIEELKKNSLLQETIDESSFIGGYPRIYAYDLNPTTWYSDYVDTYVEKDIRQLVNISKLNAFKKFVGLCAGRTGQTLNLTALANDASIDVRTVKEWLSLLETSYILFFLQPHYANFNKRLIKSPKLYFYDTGLACALIGMDSVDQLRKYHQRGAIIETFIISNIIKHYYNNGIRPRHVYFWQDKTGHEVDCLIQKVNDLIPVEIKSSLTITSDFFEGLRYWQDLTKNIYPKGYIVYGGSRDYERSEGRIVSWKNIETIFK